MLLFSSSFNFLENSTSFWKNISTFIAPALYSSISFWNFSTKLILNLFCWTILVNLFFKKFFNFSVIVLFLLDFKNLSFNVSKSSILKSITGFFLFEPMIYPFEAIDISSKLSISCITSDISATEFEIIFIIFSFKVFVRIIVLINSLALLSGKIALNNLFIL